MSEITTKEINELPGASSVGTDDLFVIEQGGVAKKAQGSTIKALAGGGFSSEAKGALLALLQKVAYTDTDAQDLYDDLETALYSNVVLVSISAVFTQGSAVIYAGDSLDTLKQYLTVTATYDDSSTATVTTYTLSGTLTVGTSTITVAYGGKTDTFTVTVSAVAWDIEWDYEDGSPLNNGFTKDAAASLSMSGEYCVLTPTSSQLSNLRRSTDFESANGVLEVVVKFESFITGTQTHYINMPKIRVAVNGNTLELVADNSNNPVQIYSGLSASQDMTIKIDYNATTGADIYLDGTKIYTWNNALTFTTATRFLLVARAASPNMYIKAIRLKAN